MMIQFVGRIFKLTALGLLVNGLCLTLVGQQRSLSEGRVATVVVEQEGIEFVPREQADAWLLTVAGPGGFSMQEQFRTPPFQIPFRQDLQDGWYTFEVRALHGPKTEVKQMANDTEARLTGIGRKVEDGPAMESGSFRVVDAVVGWISIDSPDDEPGRTVDSKIIAFADQTVNGDLLVDSGACVGLGCGGEASSEETGTVRVRGGDDTSVVPRVRFQTDDETQTGGGVNLQQWDVYAAKNDHVFTIQDDGSSGSDARSVFKIRPGAAQNSFVISSNSHIGIGTGSPSGLADIHILRDSGGNDPLIRLERTAVTGSGRWDLKTYQDPDGGNALFAITDGDTNDEIIKVLAGGGPGAIVVDGSSGQNAGSACEVDTGEVRTTGCVGIGTTAPKTQLHVRSIQKAELTVENSTSTNLARRMLSLKNAGTAIFRLTSGGSRVWDFSVTGSDTFQVNRVGDGQTEMELNSSGDLVIRGAYSSSSSREAKEDFEPVDGADVLARVRRLPLLEWTYKDDTRESRHIGPMAEDFHAEFGLGSSDKYLSPMDTSGIALAAVQGLDDQFNELNSQVNEKTRRLEEQLAEYKNDLAEKTKAIEELTRLVKTLQGQLADRPLEGSAESRR